MWRAPKDPSIHADIGVDASTLVRFQRTCQEQGHRITVSALVCRAAAYALDRVPEVNVVPRWGRMVPRRKVRVWLYATDDQGHVVGRALSDADTMDLVTMQGLIDQSSRHRSQEAPRRARRWYRRARMPTALLRGVLGIGGALTHNLGLGRRLDRDGFGAVGVTNLGSIGIEQPPSIPIPPSLRHVFMLSIGTVHDRVIAVDGEPRVVPWLPITGTLDHRAMVGIVAARVLEAFQDALTQEDLLRSFLEQA